MFSSSVRTCLGHVACGMGMHMHRFQTNVADLVPRPNIHRNLATRPRQQTTCGCATTSWTTELQDQVIESVSASKCEGMSAELEEHITARYEIRKRLGKGVSGASYSLCGSLQAIPKYLMTRLHVLTHTQHCLIMNRRMASFGKASIDGQERSWP